MQTLAFVIPCFNEANRLDERAVELLLEPGWARCVFVNDGSTDGTAELLARLRERWPAQVKVLSLAKNQGKAEAVRQGLLLATSEAELVGYADADFAAPPGELLRLAGVLDASVAQVVIGSRVALAGHRIDRQPLRHYVGRIFGTAASWILGAVIYDTQCGAKLFRVGAPLRAALADPFGSRWFFDVELLGRLLVGAPGVRPIAPEDLQEVPLREWRDVRGSKLKPSDFARTPLELLKIERLLAARRRAARTAR